jgi:hypothetical protein
MALSAGWNPRNVFRVPGPVAVWIRLCAVTARAGGVVSIDALRTGAGVARRLVEAVVAARATLKPSIPETGNGGIPLRDEIDLALALCGSGNSLPASGRQA